MGKTYKKYPLMYYRQPRGRKQALVQGARKKAVPPDAWDDIRCDKQCWLPYDLGHRFHEAGMSREEAIRKLRRKFRLSQLDAEDATSEWERKTREDYARSAFEGRSLAEKVAIRLRYQTLVEWHTEFLSFPKDDD